MKFSEIWLREWVNPAINGTELAEQITMAGLEVDGVENVAGEFSGVMVGEVVECAQHPNADKLRVTKINVGGERLLDVVCGAPNCRQGLKVACATVGAILPGDFKIKATKLRGEPSEGMLCSYSELAISDDQDGIIELPADAPVGMDLRQYLKLDDTTIEISITPNRADCLGIMGIARDVAVLNALPINEPDIQPVVATLTDSLPINVEATDACPRYLGRIVKNIDVTAPSPLWLREKLRRCGLRSIDAVVDITNYVMLELGQPMHAFDLQQISGGIVVRMAKEGEPLVLLDGSEVALSSDTLVIADQQKALAMGGIFGGKGSGVTATTKDVLLECAYFSPLAITGRARRYGLHTDSSYRYERGVDPQLQHRAIERATQLLLDICGGEAGPVTDVSSEAALPKCAQITLRRTKLDSLIGITIADDQVTDILLRLGCQVAIEGQQWQVIAPSWRFDIQIEEDLIEEVARIYGYNKIPNIPLRGDLVMPQHREQQLTLKRVKTLLVDRGYHEAITYSFVDPKVQELLHPDLQALVLPNPISTEMSVMRLSLLSGLLDAVLYNQNRQQTTVRLFESGLRFTPDPTAENGIRQEMMLSGVITGLRHEEHWDIERQSVDFYDLKGDVEAILELTGRRSELQFIAKDFAAALHPGQSAELYLSGQYIGYMGVIHPEIEQKLGMNSKTIVFELQWDSINHSIIPQAKEISRYPANRRDIAVIVAEEIPAESVLAVCRKVGVNQVVGVNLFDVYRGRGIAEGYKSLAISLILQDITRTLEEDEIAATVAKCVEALKEQFHASLRD